MKFPLNINFILIVALLLCALSLVNAQYKYRSLYIELGRKQSQNRLLEVQWAQLQLDQSTFGKSARIEANAARDLKMSLSTPARTEYLNLEEK